jgi:DNA-binding SARP family transcriptional activator
VEYRVLGAVEVRAGGRPVYVGRPREHRTLAALVLDANRVVGVDRLVDVLWGEHPPPTAAAQIRNTVATLRRHLSAANGNVVPVTRTAAGFVLGVTDDEVDLLVFNGYLTQARQHRDGGRMAPAAEALRAALDLWRGPALGGLGGPVLDGAALGLEEQRLACLEERIELDLACGRHQDLLGELATLVREHPLRERVAELHMLALYRAGRRQDALDTFGAVRRRLADDAGLDPRQQLIALHSAILRGDPSLELVRNAAAPGTGSRGPGREMSDSMTLPPSSRSPRPADYRPPSQLPREVPDFIGRAAHIAALDALAELSSVPRNPAVVLAAIDGMAGVGKTALAVHWAHRVWDRFPDGQLYVDLRGYADMPPLRPIVALTRILRGLGVPIEDIPIDVDAGADLFRTILAGRRMLLLLDNASA